MVGTVLKPNGPPLLEKQISPNPVESGRLLTVRGTKLTETRVKTLHVPPLLTMETPIMLGTTGSLYTSVQQTVALSTSLLHNPPSAPLPSPSCSGCAAGCSGSFQLVWFANSSPLHRGTSPHQTSANTVNALEVRSGVAETPSATLQRAQARGGGNRGNTALLSPDTLPPGLAPTRVLLASLDLELGCKPACLPSWSLLCRGQEWTEREERPRVPSALPA